MNPITHEEARQYIDSMKANGIDIPKNVEQELHNLLCLRSLFDFFLHCAQEGDEPILLTPKHIKDAIDLALND